MPEAERREARARYSKLPLVVKLLARRLAGERKVCDLDPAQCQNTINNAQSLTVTDTVFRSVPCETTPSAQW